MKKLISLIAFCLAFSIAYSGDLYSIADGNWTSGSVWSYTPGGPPCNCYPASSDNITVNHQINLNIHLINQGSSQNGITGVLTINGGASLSGNYDIDIRSSGTLILCGTLNVRNVIFSNGSTVEVCSTGEFIINGSFENKNNSNTVIINGNMTVHGSYTNGNGGIISGSGTITITNGPATNTGNTFGCEGSNPCSSYPCTVTPCNVLPIKLVSFTASVKSNYVDLEWITASELNNDFFTIEKSIDGREFITVSKHNGAGNSQNLLRYAAKDYSPYSGTSYYRLKQTDFDGKFSYSPPVAVKMHSPEGFQLIPNPSNGHNVVVVVPSSGGNHVSIYIRDLTGRIVDQRTLMPESGKKKSTFRLDPEDKLQHGVYLVTLITGDVSHTQKTIINSTSGF